METPQPASGEPAGEAAAAPSVETVGDSGDADYGLYKDLFSPDGTLVARFDQDERRAALYLITPEAKILAMVWLYNVTDWPDVDPDEVHLSWEQGSQRCSATVRGRRRYIDVQVDPPVAQAAKAA